MRVLNIHTPSHALCRPFRCCGCLRALPRCLDHAGLAGRQRRVCDAPVGPSSHTLNNWTVILRGCCETPQNHRLRGLV